MSENPGEGPAAGLMMPDGVAHGAPQAPLPDQVEPAAPVRVSRVAGLHPGWFASVMGTAIVAVATYANPGRLEGLRPIAEGVGQAVAVLAYLLGVVMTLAYAVRWTRYRAQARAELRDPMLGALHATLPGGLLVLAVMTASVGPALFSDTVVTAVVAVLAGVGAVLAVVIGVVFTYELFVGERPASAVNGGWFIPPVVTIIIPMVLTPLMSHVNGTAGRTLLVLGYAAYGLGMVLFVLTLALLYGRLVLQPLPPTPLAPTLWIVLGPVGVGAVAPLSLAAASAPYLGESAGAVGAVSLIGGTALWGFGLFWLALATSLLIRYLRAGGVPFHLGWWAFTFPLGAYTVATITVARAWQSTVLEAFGALLYLVLVAFWLVVTSRTLAATRAGTVWRR